MVKGILLIVGSLFLLKYRERVVRMTGKISWAEKYLGMGGTYRLMFILSIVWFFLGLAFLTGTMDVLLSPLDVLKTGGGGVPSAPVPTGGGW